MSSLSILDLFNCKFIQSLPTIIGDLKHLTKLELGGCENIKEVRQTIGNISSLLILDLSYCKSIELVQTIIDDLKHLMELLLARFGNLKELL
jgi:Leucine-rich repeat (LRR) protein